MFCKLACLCLALLAGMPADGLRILVAYPMLSKSHAIMGHAFVDHLLKAGHEVVHMTAFPRDTKPANYSEVSTEAVGIRIRNEHAKTETLKLKNMINNSNFGESFFFLYFTYYYNNQVLQDEAVLNFLSDPKQKFDAVVVEWFFSDILAGIAPLFQCPLIWVASTEAHMLALQMIDEIPNPAFNVDLFSANRPPLTFAQRVDELWTTIKKNSIKFISRQFERRDYYSWFPAIADKRGVTLPSFEDAIYNGSLMFFFSHPSVGTPYQLPQSAKYIGGYHISEKVQPLPKDVQTIMDNAKHGVIYFSMGSNLLSEEMSQEMIDSMLHMFGKLQQTVIWKFNGILPKVQPNIHLIKWAPQQSILAHPNLKIFITHGGQLSTIESVHYAVPVIGIPIYGDQHMNMVSVKNKGFGLTVTAAEDMADDIFEAVNEMLSNPSYKNKAIELSQIYHDRQQSPGDDLVFWIEHVVRTKGARHLRSPALGVRLYQKLFLDLIALIAIVVSAVLYIWKKIRGTLMQGGKKQKKN